MKKNEIAHILLRVAALGGLTLMAIAAPNAIQIFAPFLKKKLNKRQKYYISPVLEKLRNKGYLDIQGNGWIKITTKGEYWLNELELDELFSVKPKHWDQKYRIIIFDIPEQKGKTRSVIRHQLIDWGFVKLQNSVWVYPYDCREAIELLKTHFGLRSNILYIEAVTIENDAWLKKEFSLP